jgi:hypothetical protein
MHSKFGGFFQKILKLSLPLCRLRKWRHCYINYLQNGSDTGINWPKYSVCRFQEIQIIHYDNAVFSCASVFFILSQDIFFLFYEVAHAYFTQQWFLIQKQYRNINTWNKFDKALKICKRFVIFQKVFIKSIIGHALDLRYEPLACSEIVRSSV